jgi:phosphate transport system protein
MERQNFHRELENLRLTLYKMAALTRQSFDKSTRAYLDRDSELAQTVIDGDMEVNRIELEIDRQSLRLLALEQPMARDLRMIVGIMRISNDLERIADQCVNIAERTIFLCQHPPLDPVRAMEQLIEMSKKMFNMAINSMRDMDAEEAKKIPPLDDYADEYNMQVLKGLIEVMAASSPGFEKRVLKMRRSIQTIIISRCLERIADLSTNIGEHVAFIAEGINIKHQQL